MSTELPRAIRGFARMVAMPPNAPNWSRSFSEQLATLREEMRAHVRDTEGPGGTYAKVLRDAPRLAPGVQALVDDHRAILAALDRPPAPLVDVEGVREWAKTIVQDVSTHRQRGANLLYEAYLTDLGEPG
jgi:hypothetical protein